MKASRKKRTREHIIADLSVNYLERLILLCGYSADSPEADYGYDLVMSTYNEEGGIESGFVLFQLKATDSINILKDGKTISFTADKRDLDLWAEELYPAYLVVYDAAKEEAYWLYIQVYLEENGIDINEIGDSLNVHLQITNTVSTDRIEKFRDSKNDIVRKLREVVEHGDN